MCFIWTKCQSQGKIRPINCDVTKSAAKKLHPFIRNKILLPLCFFFWDFRQECISNEAFSIERKSLCGKLVVRLSKHLFLNKIFNDQSCAVITVTIVCCNMVTLLLLLLPWLHPKRLLAWRLPRPMSWPQLYVNPNDDQLWSKQDPWPGLAQSRIPPPPPPLISHLPTRPRAFAPLHGRREATTNAFQRRTSFISGRKTFRSLGKWFFF